MNFYEFNIGDYYRETRNLTQIRHYIYRSLLDEYYLQEMPFTDDIRRLMADMGLTSDQKEDLEYILDRYFILGDDGWENNRANEVLSRVYEKSEKARQSANSRWEREKAKKKANGRNASAMRPHCEGNANGMLPTNPVPTNPVKDTEAGASVPKRKPIPYQKIIDLYHEKCPMLPVVVKLTDERKSHIRARWNGGANTRKFWEDYFKHVANSAFLTGQKPPVPPRTKPMLADIDFLIKESTIVKMQEGKYDD